MPLNTKSYANTIPGWIYFVRCDGRIKIGFAQHPHKRFFGLKGASPVPIKSLGAMRGTAPEERALHKRWGGQTRRNEWVDATPELLKFIEMNAAPVTRAMDEESKARQERERQQRS